ncbi:uncharacterized protein LOC115634489 [Scaptodrosophila lebanonensis]|uniref:Uncharacterized protein LOC115634489 n=1 Tax=Drosophila lebanonensis TaxID=7225 RepID=A0A6J2UI44_DROLE|nr:uncharacterized protein LOC115634489 [Scaptodrosophila lebanonensis]
MQLDLLKPPVSNISVNFNIKKKLSGYRPFLYNVTFDFCRYQKHKNSYPLFKIIHGTIMNSSNFDHNCPYNHSIIIDNYVVKDESFKLTPFPSGSYLYEIIIGAYNIWRAVLTVYFDVKLN